MEIQLTKTKTITIGGGASGARRTYTDVVGVELFNGDPRGCPAVRLTKKKDGLRLVAAGFVPPPEKPLPGSWEEASKKCVWSLPSAFQAPCAALAVNSPDMFLAQTTKDAFLSDLAAGGHKSDESSAPKSKFGIRRPAATPTQGGEGGKAAAAAEPGVPISNGGMRFVMQPMKDSGGFVLEAGLPEFQALWLSRLLPEGKRPTAASIQLAPSALIASVLRQPSLGQGSLVLFVACDAVYIVGYKGGDVVLWRKCRNAPGWTAMRETLKKNLGLEDNMVENVLDDKIIDPRSVLEPIVAPIAAELLVSRDYLVGKLGVETKTVLLSGLSAGFDCWKEIARDSANLELKQIDTFDGIEASDKALIGNGLSTKGAGAQAFLAALGAAEALLEEEGEG